MVGEDTSTAVPHGGLFKLGRSDSCVVGVASSHVRGCGKTGNSPDGLLHHSYWITLGVDGADVAFTGLLVEGDVLANEYSDANTAEIKAI